MRRSNKLRKQAFWIGAAIFAGALVYGGMWSARARSVPEPPADEPVRAGTAAASPAGSSRRANPLSLSKNALSTARTRIDSTEEAQSRWRDFQDRFGTRLNPTFTPDHRLVRIRAGQEASLPADHFVTGDRGSALSRAQEVLRQAGDLIGLNPEYPLEARAVRSDDISSQIEWVQTYQGVPIEPYGRITVQLDGDGGLHALYSSYVSDPRISNTPSLTDDSARLAAFPHLHFTPDRPLEAGPSPKGDLILFAQGPQVSSEPIELKYAYRYWVSGREVVVDAARGEILSEKDRRQF